MRARTSVSRGATLVETALATIVFLMLFVGILDFARVYHARSDLKYAVSQSARFATLGATIPDPNDPTVKLSRAASIKHMILEKSQVPNVDPDKIDISSIDEFGVQSPGPGGPGDSVAVRVRHDVSLFAPYMPLVFGGSKYVVSVGATFRNEEFIPGA